MSVDKRQVRGRTVDGLKWHAVHSFEPDRDRVETCCGEIYRISEIEISEIGEQPRGLSGTTICYRCASSHAKPAEQDQEVSA